MKNVQVAGSSQVLVVDARYSLQTPMLN